MGLAKGFLVAGAMACVALTSSGEAEACGGCFTGQSESTQVSGHRMVLSVGMDQTTLFDQITYSGEPSSFAWVLPIRGTVDVGLSTDVLFQTLEAHTQVRVQSPSICPNSCEGGGRNFATSVGGEYDSQSDGVEVLKQEVVGPYETVQLSAEDPAALGNWLVNHGYSVPDEVKPVIDDYVGKGFDFLALKLVPGEGVAAMRPVRVTTKGAGFSLPLKMVAAGTGETTPIVLWVIGEGRYEAANFPSVAIAEEELVWDWDTQSSNYAALRKQKLEASGGFAWMTEASWYYSENWLWAAIYSEGMEQYADADGANAENNLQAEMELIFSGLDPDSTWLTRLSTELSRKALQNDLTVGASPTQTEVWNFLNASTTIGTWPEPASPCPPDPCAPGAIPFGDPTAQSGEDDAAPPATGAFCQVGHGAGAPGLFVGAGLFGALAFLRRRRRTSRGA